MEFDFGLEASPVRTCPLPDNAQDWLESDLDFGSSSIALLQAAAQSGWLSRTSPVCYPAMEGEILPSSFGGWSNSGMACAGGFLTLSMPEWHNDAAVCSLSAVLETDVPRKYYLSAKAARGILRRAEKRGKDLPEMLHRALLDVAQGVEPMETTYGPEKGAVTLEEWKEEAV